jgi:DNA-binding winged helix-turn-helix (wHTH) protein
MTADAQRRVFRFGVFEADETTGELRKHGIRLKLHSQPFQLLVMLLERPSQLVTREEMRQRLWGEDTFVDFDHGLNSAVNKLREALSDSAANPRHIETIAGKGYRFVAPVEIAQPPVAESAAVVVPPSGLAASKLGSGPVAPAIIETVAAGDSRSGRAILAAPDELPSAPRALVRTLLLLTQAMYLAFYVGALANLDEIREIFADAQVLSPSLLMGVLVVTAVVLIPVRLYLSSAVAFDFLRLREKFQRLFPILLPLDLLWALAPFLLIHHLNLGVILAMIAALLYLPFAQRSLVLMYALER